MMPVTRACGGHRVPKASPGITTCVCQQRAGHPKTPTPLESRTRKPGTAESDASVLGGGGVLRPWLGFWGQGEALQEPAQLCCGFESKKARRRISLALKGSHVMIRQCLNIFHIVTFNMQLHSRENVVWEEGCRVKAALHHGG